MYLDVNYFQFELARKFELTEVEWAISTVKTYPKEELRIKQKMLPQRTFFCVMMALADFSNWRTFASR